MGEPSKKSEEVEQAITALFGIDRREAIRNDICAWCGKEARVFTDNISRREYAISGLCQDCQDKAFRRKDE